MSLYIHLQSKFGLPWQKIGNFYFRGNFDFQPFQPDFDGAENFLKNSAGNFIWIYEDEEKVLFGTDTIRSYPLWYFYDGKEFCLSDDISFLKGKFQPKVNEEQLYFFEHVGYTCGEATLLENIYCPQALSIFEFDKRNSTIRSKHIVLQESNSNIEEFEKPFNEVSSRLFENLVEKLENKTAFIPLSAGWDSRFILAGLVKKGFSNIICFTYGKTNSYEIEIARATCEKLNIPWHFVEYNDAVFENYKTAFAWEYEQFASQYTSIAYEQDFFAVWKLKQDNILPSDSVFLPGYCGDLLSGSKLPHLSEKNDNKFLINKIIDTQLGKDFIGNKRITELLKKHTKIYIDSLMHLDSFLQFEHWYGNHKSNKFINNGVRCYEYFGYEWIVPFSFYEYMQFWFGISPASRSGRTLYKEMITKHYFKPLGIDFDNETMAEKLELSSVKKLNSILPESVKHFLKNILLKTSEQDVNSLMNFGKILLKDAGIERNAKDENQAHALWLLKKLGLSNHR